MYEGGNTNYMYTGNCYSKRNYKGTAFRYS